jgi:hypothetical protein
MQSVFRPLSFCRFRLQPQLDQAADGLRAVNFSRLGPRIDVGSEINRQPNCRNGVSSCSRAPALFLVYLN